VRVPRPAVAEQPTLTAVLLLALHHFQ
jgi:hypothetical protein